MLETDYLDAFMIYYFIADLHLSEAHPELTELFMSFMSKDAQQAQAVYILGDLFDFWIGDDECSALIDKVKGAIKGLVDNGVACYFIHGNRDFLIGKKFAQETGMVLLPEYQLINLFGQTILLCHGDTLCIDDVRYQRFRQKVHQRWLQKFFLSLPLSIRMKIAKKIRYKTKQDKQQKSFEIMDANLKFTEDTVMKYGVNCLIHGHTHRQNIHQNTIFTRIVLGDWKPSKPSILKVDENGFSFIE